MTVDEFQIILTNYCKTVAHVFGPHSVGTRRDDNFLNNLGIQSVMHPSAARLDWINFLPPDVVPRRRKMHHHVIMPRKYNMRLNRCCNLNQLLKFTYKKKSLPVYLTYEFFSK